MCYGSMRKACKCLVVKQQRGMSNMQGQFPWSDSGLNLLKIIEGIVEDNGGSDEMYIKVFVEVTENSWKRNRVAVRHKIKALRYNRVPRNVIKDVLNLTDHELEMISRDISKEAV